jgi:NADPH-dependent glutamate synthase beta subunit-like oxidoreductase
MAVEGRTHKPVVDYNRCETCGVCLKACPAEAIPDFRQEPESLRGKLYAGSDADPKINVTKVFDLPNCQATCPIRQDVRGYMRLIAEGRYGEAIELIREANPLPSVCAYVCHHPCESACTRGRVDDPLSIRSLKRFVTDYDDGRLHPPGKGIAKGKKVVIIGSGPAGLAAGHELARMGYEVEMIESYRKAGGFLAWAIPSFRLPGEILQRDIDYIRKMGITIRTGTTFGSDVKLSDFRNNGAHAVIVATGTQKSLKLRIENEDRPQGVLDCLDFLKACSEGRPLDLGRDVLVIGGGNAAVDTARSALRIRGTKVTIVYRRTLEEMPADREEIGEALREGVRIEYLAAPKKVLVSGDKVIGLECLKTELREADGSGRKRPVPVEGSEFVIGADTIISAVGQEQDYGPVTAGLASEGKALAVDRETLQVRGDGIFAAGDFVNGAGTVVEAMASGKKAAQAVARYLQER